MIILRQILISIVAAFLIWRIGVVGISFHYAQLIIEGERDAVSKALTWDKRQPEALYRQAVALRNDDPGTAATLLAQANAHYMADARPFFAAAKAALTKGDQARADTLIKMALRLRPADPRIQQQAGEYWLLRNDVKQAILHYSRTLETHRGHGEGYSHFCSSSRKILILGLPIKALRTHPRPGGTPFSPKSLKVQGRSKPFSNSTLYGAGRDRHRSRCPNGKAMSLGL